MARTKRILTNRLLSEPKARFNCGTQLQPTAHLPQPFSACCTITAQLTFCVPNFILEPTHTTPSPIANCQNFFTATNKFHDHCTRHHGLILFRTTFLSPKAHLHHFTKSRIPQAQATTKIYTVLRELSPPQHSKNLNKKMNPIIKKKKLKRKSMRIPCISKF